jgi:hypothetical protein
MKEALKIKRPTEIKLQIDFPAMKFSLKQRPIQAFSGGEMK